MLRIDIGKEPKSLPMRLAGVIRESIVDGPGLRFVVFTQGCPHHCEGCHNPETHDFNGGYETTTVDVWKKIKETKLLRGVTFSGGEPFAQAAQLAEIGEAARDRGLDVMTYSGYTAEQLFELAEKNEGVHKLLCATNYLVDGRFVLEERDLGLLFRGSRNQRLLDITCYPNSKEYTVLESIK